jgi:tetratricopeptide (TPR) repeat protein
MTQSSQVGARFETATLELFKRILPRLGFTVISHDVRRSGTQKGFDLLFQTRLHDAKDVRVNLFIECKGATSINQLPLEEFEGKPDQLVNSRFNPDYWILFSPLRYLTNEFQENLSFWNRTQYPFALVTWTRPAKDEDRAGLYLDLYKHFPETYAVFREDVPANIRDTPPAQSLDEALTHLRTSINNSYDEFEDRVVFKGLIPGVRRITPQSIYNSIELDDSRLAKIRKGYYMLNSSDRFVWKAVCNDLDVRNAKLSEELVRAVQHVTNPTESIWILGAPGCGKTTQMNRTAIDFANASYPVLLINSLELDESASLIDYEKYLRTIFALHHAGREITETKPLLVLIDNPAARIEAIARLLDRFDGLEENLKCIFLLFEREVRYHQAEEENFLPDFVGMSKEKIYVDNRNASFKEQVYESFATALDLPVNDRAIAKGAFLENPLISIAEAVISFCKRTNNDKYKRFAMDWADFDESIKRLGLNSLADLYKWISIVYQFGIAMPISILAKVLPDFSENEFLDFRDFFTSGEYENLPVIVERQTLRARHELISRWHVEEKLSPTMRDRLVVLLSVIDSDDALERSVFSSLVGRKQIALNFLAELDESELKRLQATAVRHPLSQRVLMMVGGWTHFAKREYSTARDVFKAVMKDHPNFLPPILETARAEFALGNESEAERLLYRLLGRHDKNLYARTELAKLYRKQGRYDNAEKLLHECLKLDPEHFHARFELAKIYEDEKRYEAAERVLQECLTLDPQYSHTHTQLARVYLAQKRYGDAEQLLNEVIRSNPEQVRPLMELATVYQARKRYDEAETTLLRCLELNPADLNSRTELAKVYQAQKRYGKAEKVLQESLLIDSQQLHSRTELARVYQAQDRIDDAEVVLQELLELEPNSILARTELGRVYRAQKRYREAQNILEDSLTIEPGNLQARTELAKLFQVQQLYHQAEGLLLTCLDLSGDDLNSRTELARIYQAQERYDEAEKILLKCVELSEDDLNSRTELAKVYQAQKRYDKAEHILKELLELDRKNVRAHTELSKVYQAQERYADAETILIESLQLEPEHLHALTELARVYKAQNQHSAAEEMLLKCMSISSNDLVSRTELAKLYQIQGKHLLAEGLLRRCLSLSATDRYSRVLLVRVLQEQGRSAEAERILEGLLTIDPHQPYAGRELARLYESRGQYAKAEVLMTDSLRLNPNQSHTRLELARIYQAQKRYAEAEQVLKESLVIDHTQLYARTELARVYIKQGWARRARAEVFDFFKENPNADPDDTAHLILTHLNACYVMRRFQEGVALVDRLGCQFVSPELAEEYGRLLRSYDLPNAASFFTTAAFFFNDSSRLLSEAAICFKLAGRDNAETLLTKAIKLAPERESKYRHFYEIGRSAGQIDFAKTDLRGSIESISQTTHFDRPALEGAIKTEERTYRFRATRYLDELFSKLAVNDPVLFDVSDRGYALNIEPEF